MAEIKKSVENFLQLTTCIIDLHHTLSVKRFLYVDAHKSKPFGKAFVDFEPDDLERNYVVRLKTIFQEGFDCLEKFISNEMDQLSRSQKESMQCLFKFLKDKDRHLQCLAPFMSKGKTVQENETEKISKEALYTFLLAEHLFAPLIPGSCYLFDKNHFPRKLTECPGGCHARRQDTTKRLQLTHTGIGHADVWHGYVDIFLETGVSVTVRDDSSNYAYPEDDLESEEDEFGHQMTVTEGAEKWINYFSVVEMKQEKETLGVDETVRQTVSQTIVNAFMQRKKHLFIPTLCASYGSIKVYMYDPEHDIFMMTPEHCTLEIFNFESKTFLSDVNIIYLWMILNFGVFSRLPEKIIEMVEKNGLQSGFTKFAGNKIHIYRDKLKYGLNSFQSELGLKPCPVLHIFLEDQS